MNLTGMDRSCCSLQKGTFAWTRSTLNTTFRVSFLLLVLQSPVGGFKVTNIARSSSCARLDESNCLRGVMFHFLASQPSLTSQLSQWESANRVVQEYTPLALASLKWWSLGFILNIMILGIIFLSFIMLKNQIFQDNCRNCKFFCLSPVSSYPRIVTHEKESKTKNIKNHGRAHFLLFMSSSHSSPRSYPHAYVST